MITLVATTSSPFVAAAVLKAGLNPCRLLTLGLVNLNNFWIYSAKKQKMNLPTYGPSSDEEWSQIIIHQEVNGPTSGEEWPQHTCNYRHKSTDQPTGRLVTVDIDGRLDSTHGRTQSISTIGSVTPTENYGRSWIVDYRSRQFCVRLNR